MGLLARDRGNIKPFTGEPIDWAHPHAKGLVCCIPLNKWHPVDLVTGSPLTPTGAPLWVNSTFGPAINTNGSSQYLGGTLSKSIAGGPFTIIAWGRPAAQHARTTLCVGSTSGLSTDRALFNFRYNTQIRFDFGANAQATLSSDDGWGTRTDRWYMAAGVASSSSQHNSYGFLEGVYKAAGTNNPGGWYTGNQNFALGFDYGGSTYWTGDIGGVLIYDRALSLEELCEIAAAPFDFIGEDEDSYIIPAGGDVKTVGDGGHGADVLAAVAVALSLADAGHGADASPSPGARVPLAESGHGTDALAQVLAALRVAEPGHGADSLTQILASLVIADTGQGADAIHLPSADLKTVGDGGGGADMVGGVSVVIPVSDSGRGLDLAGLIRVILAVADSGRGVDVAIRYVPTGAKRVIVTFSKKNPSASFSGRSASASFAVKKPGADFDN